MTVKQYVDSILRNWPVALIGLVVTLILVGTYLAVRTPDYTARSTLYVSAQTDANADSAYQGSLLSEQRVASYTQLINSTRISAEVARVQQLSSTPEELSERLVATSELDSVVITISATDPNPDTAAEIANTAAAAAVTMVDGLERPTRPSVAPPVSMRIVERAGSPADMSSVSALAVAAGGLILGVLVGVLLALIRDKLDTTVRTSLQLREVANTPTLAEVPRTSALAEKPLNRDLVTQSQAFESFRTLRTNLQFVSVDQTRAAIVVTSSISNEGKSSIAINLALALSVAGKSTLLVDADLRKAQITETLGAVGTVGLTTVLLGQVSVGEAVQRTQYGAFDVLAAGILPPNPGELLSSSSMSKLLATIHQRYDYVVLDSAPLLPVADTLALAAHVDGVLLVCSTSTSRGQLRETVEKLAAVSARVIGSVLNFTKQSEQKYGAYGYGNPPMPADDDESDRTVTLQDASNHRRRGRSSTDGDRLNRQPSPHRKG